MLKEEEIQERWKEQLDFFPSVRPIQAVVKGTNIAVAEILKSLAEGRSVDEVKSNRPELNDDAIKAIFRYTQNMVDQEDHWRGMCSDESIAMNADIITFFQWVSEGLDLAEFLMRGEPYGNSAPTFGLVICYTILDVMSISYNYGKPTPNKTNLKKYIAGAKTIRRFIMHFKSASFPLDKIFEIEMIFRDDTTSTEKFDEIDLLSYARNHATHTGRSIGIFSKWDAWNQGQLFVDDSPPLGAKGIYRSISLVPNSLLSFIRQLAEAYEAFCRKKRRDPRFYINPVELHLKKINDTPVTTW